MIALLLFFAAFVLADIFLAAAIVWHLRAYTLDEWSAEKILIPIYLVATGFLLALALVSFLRVRELPDALQKQPMQFFNAFSGHD